jgi:hypothetical protein
LPDQHDEDDTTRATARLPGLEIEIVHRRLPQHDAELISINLQAMPSFEAFAVCRDWQPVCVLGPDRPNGVASLARSRASPDAVLECGAGAAEARPRDDRGAAAGSEERRNLALLHYGLRQPSD